MADNEFDKSKIESKVPMNRYFLIAAAIVINGKLSFCNVKIVTAGIFPSENDIEKDLPSKDITDFAVISVFEFKSESDYNQFIKE